MTMKVECAGCGEDCSNSYGTHMGLPYHMGCIPVGKHPRRDALDDADDRDFETWRSDR